MISINRDSFSPISSDEVSQVGTIEVTMFGETRTVNARKFESGTLAAYGIEGRYQTGAKWWDGKVFLNIDGSTLVSFGRDDRNPKFTKSNIRFKAA
jgi:hypothetical protein